MKFLILTNHSYMLWQFRRELIEALIARGEVVIGTPFGEHVSDFEAMGCRMIETAVDRRGINPFKDLGLYRTYCRLLKDEKPDVVITYSIKPNIYGGYACRKAGIPYCVNVQGVGTAFQKKGLATLVSVMYRVAMKGAKAVFFENDDNAALFLDKKIIPAEKACVLPGAGINLTHYTYRAYPANEPLRILYLGRIMKEKGMDELFAAIRTLRREGYRFTLDLVGFFEDSYKKKVDELIAEGVAKFHGFQQDPRPYYEQADCVVLPSYHEGMSNVLLEAAATGRPLITSDIGGCREAVSPDESGFLCPSKDSEALTACLRRLLALSREEREAMGQAGRQRMEERFEKSMVVDMTVERIVSL
jgi:glycosyltransferase involved in cell wall biosynthesis